MSTAADTAQYLATEDEHLAGLHRIITDAMQEERSLTRMLRDEARTDDRTRGERLADRITTFGGSWAFILFFAGTIALWVIVNAVLLTRKAFDPYPFVFLNLVLSCISAFQAPVVLMSQNRQEAKDRARAEKDYLINLRAEMEIRSLHRKVDLGMQEQYTHLCDMLQQQMELLKRTQDAARPSPQK